MSLYFEDSDTLHHIGQYCLHRFSTFCEPNNLTNIVFYSMGYVDLIDAVMIYFVMS